MKRYTAEILSETTGLSVLGATLSVVVPGTDTRVVLYKADDTAGAVQAQPVPNGAAFYAPDGRYDLIATKAGRTVRIPSVDLYDGHEQNRRLEAVENGEPGALGSLRADLIQPAPAKGTKLVKHRGRRGTYRDLDTVLNSMPLFAANEGVAGDAQVVNGAVVGTDDTAALQAVLDYAKANKIGVVYCGSMRCKISGPLVCDHVGLVFDGQGYAENDPGLLPVGSGYTCVTVKGIVADFRVGIWGLGSVTFDATNGIVADTRPDVTGFQFSDAQDLGPLALSRIGYARAWKLRRGILVKGMWDTNIEKFSAEYCGGPGADDFAIDVQDGGFVGQTTNESPIAYIQAEHSVWRAIRFSPNLLSCPIVKVHSERAFAKAGVVTWQFSGGSCDYGALRLNATVAGNPNAPKGTAIFGGAGTVFRVPRAEEDVIVRYSVAENGTCTLIEPSLSLLEPAAGQNGHLVVIGGTVTGQNIDGNVRFFGTRLPKISCGFAAADLAVLLVACDVGEVTATSTQAAIDLHDCSAQINPAGFRSIRALGTTVLRPITGASLTFGYQYVFVDTPAVIKADVTADYAGIDLHGRIEGAYLIITQLRTIASETASVTGALTNFGPPTGTDFIGSPGRGRKCKNLAVAVGAPVGWIADQGQVWRPLANL